MSWPAKESRRNGELKMSSLSSEPTRLSADDWRKECDRQAATPATAIPGSPEPVVEFRRKLADGEVVSKALEKLAEALGFSGRITLTFHQGKLTKMVLEESYFRGRGAM